MSRSLLISDESNQSPRRQTNEGATTRRKLVPGATIFFFNNQQVWHLISVAYRTRASRGICQTCRSDLGLLDLCVVRAAAFLCRVLFSSLAMAKDHHFSTRTTSSYQQNSFLFGFLRPRCKPPDLSISALHMRL